jgi:hypothetical protein
LRFVASYERGNIPDCLDLFPDGVVDLANLETLAAKLDLVIGSAKEVEAPIVENTDKVARSIHSLSKLLQSGKLLRREVVALEVALANQSSRDAELTHGASQNRLLCSWLQHVGPDVDKLPANIGRATGSRHTREDGHSDGSLGRPIEVVNNSLGTPDIQDFLLQGLAARDEDASTKGWHIVGMQQPSEAGGKVDVRDP